MNKLDEGINQGTFLGIFYKDSSAENKRFLRSGFGIFNGIFFKNQLRLFIIFINVSYTRINYNKIVSIKILRKQKI